MIMRSEEQRPYCGFEGSQRITFGPSEKSHAWKRI